ncbi:cation:proton antiporter [Paucilactobacillus kaifaensis]|uniref:cation:proton antiporter n=1 Tax=Paucilactobacillus kaifaensis TaxID=2559921 RepID=UPI0010FA0B10|nr:cation:proton antiporter [Paucilactobacillus kaifaensis]
MAFIATLAGLLLATQIVAHLCHRIGIPGVIGEIMVGILVGPAILNWVQLDPMMNEFQNIGVILLMFIGGLESDLELLRKYLKPAIFVAVIGVIFPVVIMGATSYLFGFTLMEALFIGVIFSATSVSISVAVLKEFHYLDTKEGATILGAAVADDIIGVILLSIMISLMHGTGTKTAGLTSGLGIILLEQVVFFGGVYGLVKWLAPYLMKLSEKLLTIAAPTVMSMVICMSMAAIADLVGLSGAVGAFFAGIAVAHTKNREVVDKSVEPLGYAIFIPLFFVSVGLNMNFAHLNQSLVFVIVMTVLACVTKLLGCGFGAALNGFSLTSDYIVGAGMISRGEMALITAQIGFNAHLLSGTYYSDIILVIILATIIAPFLLKHAIHRQQQGLVDKKLNQHSLQVNN